MINGDGLTPIIWVYVCHDSNGLNNTNVQQIEVGIQGPISNENVGFW